MLGLTYKQALYAEVRTHTHDIPHASSPQGLLLARVRHSRRSVACSSIGLPGDGVLDITFVGDKYTDMGQFHNDVLRVSSALLSYEPFKSRADQIHINHVDNTVSLGPSVIRT